MEVLVVPDADAGASLVADVVEGVVRARPEAVLGLATGSSPLGAYARLRERHRLGTGPDYGRVTCFTLDEYVGLPPGSPASYRATIARELTDGLGIPAEQVHGPDPTPATLEQAGEAYDAAIAAAGGIDLQLLGIGRDGHLAFNEPGSSLASGTRLKTLTALTRRDNARFFDSPDDVPRLVLTQGLGTIRRARRLLLVASGRAKAPAVAAAVEGPITASCPASVLQLHPRVTVVLDEEAASLLDRLDYYREVQEARPPWQRP